MNRTGRIPWVCALAILPIIGHLAHGAAGDLDPTFGNSGKVRTALSRYGATASAVAVQPDGKVVVAGFVLPDVGMYAFAVVRYDSDGSLDASFGDNGVTKTSFGPGASAIASAVALQPDGKVIVAGSVSNITMNFTIVRYDSDGHLDETFGVGGIATAEFFRAHSDALAVAIQPDMKIVVAGVAYTNTDEGPNFAVARFNADGSLDSSFGGGTITTDFAQAADSAHAIAVQPDGKMNVVGSSSGDRGGFAVARYGLDGNLDDSFGTRGRTTTRYFGSYAEGLAAVLQPDGKLIVAGTAADGARNYFALARYDADGTLDGSFGNGGSPTMAFLGVDVANAVVLQPDGRIIAAGWASPHGNGDLYDFALARYASDGTLDSSFGIGGRVTTDFSGFADLAAGAALQPDGKIVVVGTSSDGTGNQFALARYQGVDGGSVTTTSTTSTSSTTVPCATARCILDSAIASPACSGQTVPRNVKRKLGRATSLIDRAARTPVKHGGRLLKQAKHLLMEAAARVVHAATGKKPKLSADCARAVAEAAGMAARQNQPDG